MTTHETTPVSSHGSAHVDAGIKPYLYTFGALILLLVATVEVARHDLGWFNFPMTMLIATSKAVLILWIFMGLKKSTSLTRLFAAMGFIWLGILLLLTMADYLTRDPHWIHQ